MPATSTISSPSPDQAPAAKTKVAVIAGAPRGGTTIANMVLGQHPQIFATGSMRDFPDGGQLFADTNICSCGQRARDCPFWTEVRSRYRPYHQQSEQEKLPRLFRIMAEVSAREFIGDVTHNRHYAERLLELPNIELYLIHVVRDGRGVVFSRIRKDYRAARLEKYGWRHFRRTMQISRHWSRHVRDFAALEKQLGKRAVRISYEQLCSDPVAALRPVGRCLGLDFAAVGAHLAAGKPLRPMPHLIRGNPVLRLKRDVVLRHDLAFRDKMHLLDRLTFQLMSRLPPF
jgi:hypothetical protein